MLLTELKPYQQRAAIFAFVKRKAALIMDKGTGKTISSLKTLTLCKAANVVLLTGSQASLINWENQIREHLGWEPRREKNGFVVDTPWGKITASTYRTIPYTTKPDLFILDESHNVKNRKAKCTRKMLNYCKKYPNARKIIMTATPASQNQVDLWAQYAMLGLHPIWRDFENKFCEPSGFMGKSRSIMPEMISQYLDEISKLSYYQSQDVLNLHGHTEIVVPVDLSPLAQTVYETLSKDFVLEFEDIQQITPNALAKLVKMHQVCGGSVITDLGIRNLECAKVDWVRRYVKANREKVVIFCAYNAELAMLSAMLDENHITYRVLHGGVKDKAVWVQFQKREDIQVMLCQFRSGAQSIDLFAASTAIYYSTTFHYIDYDQSVGRIRRMGQTKPTVCYFLQTVDTIDEVIYSNLNKKDRMLTSIFNVMKRKGASK